MSGTLHHIDCIALASDVKADLVYVDPPWCTGRQFKLKSGEIAYDDRWGSIYKDAEPWVLAEDTSPLLFRLPPDLRRYMRFLARRLLHIRGLLGDRGLLYVHVDPRFSHYVRVILDSIFSPRGFVAEVVWRYRRWSTRSRTFQAMHDTLFVYSKGERWTHNELYEPLASSTLRTFKGKQQKADFSSGRRKPSIVEEASMGALLSDVWDIGVVPPSGRERTGYPTQKPEKLLERVILASSNPGDTVLDPFCGSGTMLAVAGRLGRRWIGCDTSPVAIAVTKKRLKGVVS